MRMTTAEFDTIMDECPYGNPTAVPDLIKQRYTNIKFNEAVNERHMAFGENYRYFSEFFPTEVWQDGMGQDMITEEYYHPRINYSFAYFARSMQVCDPDGADECFTDYCTIPKGGYGNLPGPEMYRWGFKTDPMCVANIRHVRDFKKWAKRIIDTRHAVDEQVMNMFYTFMAIRTSGHKVVLENDDEGNPYPNSNPRNPFGGFKYSYMDQEFPALTNPENLRPLSLDVLDILAERWHTFNRNGHVAIDKSRNARIWEFWHPQDWYRDEVLQNGDYIEKIKHTMPEKMFAGFKNAADGGEREIIGNWSMRQMPGLPRFNVSCEGGVIPIDAHTNVEVEIGQEPVEAREWINAPIILVMAPSPTQGTILKRPDLTESAEGFPIMPIMGSGDWLIRNEYDKVCNPDRNMPWTQKRYEMGFMLKDPNAGISILSRARKFRLRPTSTCDLQPIGKVPVNRPDCGVAGVGCEDNKVFADPHITKSNYATKVICSASVCINESNDGSKPWRYRVQLERKGQRPGFNQLDCACGKTVQLVIHDANGEEKRTQQATVDEIIPHNLSPIPYAYVSTATQLTGGECIKGVLCEDDTPDAGNVTSWFVWDESLDCPEFDGARYVLDSVLSCNEGDAVLIEYLDANGDLIDPPGQISGTIADAVQAHFVYTVTSVDGDAFTVPEGTASVRLTCDAGG